LSNSVRCFFASSVFRRRMFRFEEAGFASLEFGVQQKRLRGRDRLGRPAFLLRRHRSPLWSLAFTRARCSASLFAAISTAPPAAPWRRSARARLGGQFDLPFGILARLSLVQQPQPSFSDMVPTGLLPRPPGPTRGVPSEIFRAGPEPFRDASAASLALKASPTANRHARASYRSQLVAMSSGTS